MVDSPKTKVAIWLTLAMQILKTILDVVFS